jgi:macrodomain Ter protein organizer (MatP/YcbG family)
MESTKVISFRLPYSEYQKIILECEAKGITTSEYIERKIAAAEATDQFKKKITSKLKIVSLYFSLDPESAKDKLDKIIDLMKGF